MRNDAGMRCEVAREALSARLDGERPQVLAQQVDAHLESCRRCRTWLIGAAAQTRRFATVDAGQGPDLANRIMATAGITSTPSYRRWLRGLGAGRWRWCLIAVGVFQVAIAAAQIGGIDFGIMPHHVHGGMTGEHLLHESTAWVLALGLAMIAAGIWTGAAVGVAAMTGADSLTLGRYVGIDARNGEVTAARVASHGPVLAGLAFALLVARDRHGARRSRRSDAEPDTHTRPAAASPPRHRRHLWPINSATTAGRMQGATSRLRCMPMSASSDDDAVTALALAAADGNPRALEAFIKATQQDVWRFVTYLSDAGSADDLTQETFLRAIGSIQRFAGRSTARTWLLAIARRVVADHIRHIRSRPRTAHNADTEYLLDGGRHSRGFEELVEVTTMIADLSTDQREALLLTQILGLSYADTAAVCGCPVGTIRSRVARARDALLAETERDGLTG
ncbi:ECF RNA polymerase sigma factor SigC [Mycobacterium simulans]|uniref:RNA polymerase sigma factor n=2 Tax=Mycobacterium simulans TaxID=627089 RepID=A0A7Z7INX2_9MYCO|nr:ECF RNA polymerase sigma factor SigC [Mycobacterium simulans]